MNNKHVFVSGGAGVIGLEIIPRLIERGAIVMVGDLKPRPKSFSPNVIYRQGDLNTMTAQEFAQFRPEMFIHLAATFERSTESYEFWEENFWHNVRLSHHLMTIAKDLTSLQRVVFASSYLIYDPTLYQFDKPQSVAVSLNESHTVLPRNLVGAAKFSHEIELRFIDQFKSSKFTTVCARIYRGYGRGSRDVISRWVRNLLLNQSITVFRPEGLFDYIYAADTAEGLIRLAEHENETGIVNLGTGHARSVQEVIDVLRQHFPGMVAHVVDSDIPYEASQADMSRYSARIGWVPEYTLESAIPEIIAFERKKLDTLESNSERTPTILVSSASRKIPLVRAMQHAARKLHPKAKVIAGDLDPAALAAHVADVFWCMPPTKEIHLAEIVQGCKERGITAILPTRDGELLFWSQYASVFVEAGIAVITSPAESISLCVDKLAFANFAKVNELAFIPAALDISAFASDTYVVKERFGAGARGIGLNLEEEAARDHAKKLEKPIFQPYIEGVEISVDAWLNAAHQVKGLVLRRRDSLLNGESQVTTTFSDPAIEAVVIKILSALKLSGPVVLQAIVTDGRILQVIECNARFGGASTTAIAAGLDSLYWSLLEAHGVDVSSYAFVRIPGEIRQVRVPFDLYFNVDDSNL